MNEEATRLKELAPRDELALIIREATAQVEADLALEDQGWINLSATSGDVILPADRILNLKLSRLYYNKDPLGKQSIRLWTDYTFGSGMVWDSDEKTTKDVLSQFWKAPENKSVLSARGQRKSSDKLLVDGEVFFALFLGAKSDVKIRFIDPLQITEIITNPDDVEDVRYYRRQWSDMQAKLHDEYYCDVTNVKDEGTLDMYGKPIRKTQDALIYHLTYNTITQRGNPLLLPALTWMKYYTRFLSSRIAVMLALSRFAWRSKVAGGQAAVDAIKGKLHDETPEAGAVLMENMGVDTTPIKADSGARNAYQDGRMVKLQVCAAVGIPEQYFGDISIGNLATAKTVELPMLKMFQSYQAVWDGAYQDIDEVVLAHANVPPDKRYVDRDFPPIVPRDVAEAAKAIVDITSVFPEFVESPDVQAIALLTIGVNDPDEVLEALKESFKRNPSIALTKALKGFREVLKVSGNGNH